MSDEARKKRTELLINHMKKEFSPERAWSKLHGILCMSHCFEGVLVFVLFLVLPAVVGGGDLSCETDMECEEKYLERLGN